MNKVEVEPRKATAAEIRWLVASLLLMLLEIAVLLATMIGAIFLLGIAIKALFVSDHTKGFVMLGLFGCSCVFFLWLGKTLDRWVHAHRYTGPPLVQAR